LISGPGPFFSRPWSGNSHLMKFAPPTNTSKGGFLAQKKSFSSPSLGSSLVFSLLTPPLFSVSSRRDPVSLRILRYTRSVDLSLYWVPDFLGSQDYGMFGGFFSQEPAGLLSPSSSASTFSWIGSAYLSPPRYFSLFSFSAVEHPPSPALFSWSLGFDPSPSCTAVSVRISFPGNAQGGRCTSLLPPFPLYRAGIHKANHPNHPPCWPEAFSILFRQPDSRVHIPSSQSSCSSRGSC